MDDFDFGDIGGLDGPGERPKKRENVFKGFAKGLFAGTTDALREYLPSVGSTVDSAKDLTQTLREQADEVKKHAKKSSNFVKDVVVDVLKIRKEMKSARSLRGKLEKFEAGVDKAKYNTGTKLESFLKKESSGTSSQYNQANNEFEKYSPNQHTEAVAAAIQNSAYDDTGLRSTVVDAAADVISSNTKLFRQTTIISTKQHIEKMAVLNQLRDNAALTAKFNAEVLGPNIKTLTENFKKLSEALGDYYASQGQADSGTSLYNQMLARQKAKFGTSGKKNIMDFITSDGGLDINELTKHSISQSKKAFNNSMVGTLFGFAEMLPMMLQTGDPFSLMQFLGKKTAKVALKGLSKPMGAINEQLKSILPASLLNLNKWAKNHDNRVINSIADILDLDVSPKKAPSINAINRRVPLDSVMRTSIVEVIPAYLAQMTAALTGTAERQYDHKTKRWSTKAKLDAKHRNDIEFAGSSSMYGAQSALTKGINNATISKDFARILQNIMMSSGSFDSSKLNDSKIAQYGKGTSSPEAIKLFISQWDKLSNKDKADIQIQLFQSKAARNNALDAIGLSAEEYGTSSNITATSAKEEIEDLLSRKYDLSKFDKLKNDKKTPMNKQQLADYESQLKYNTGIDTKIAEIKATRLTDSKVSQYSSVGGKIDRIFDLLLGGILVFPQKEYPKHLEKWRKSRQDEIEASKDKEIEDTSSIYKGVLNELNSKLSNDLEKLRSWKKEAREQTASDKLNNWLKDKSGFGTTIAKIPGVAKAASLFTKFDKNVAFEYIRDKGHDIADKLDNTLNSSLFSQGGIDPDKMLSKIKNTDMYDSASKVINAIKNGEFSTVGNNLKELGSKAADGIKSGFNKAKNASYNAYENAKANIEKTEAHKQASVIAQLMTTKDGRREIMSFLDNVKNSGIELSKNTKDDTLKMLGDLKDKLSAEFGVFFDSRSKEAQKASKNSPKPKFMTNEESKIILSNETRRRDKANANEKAGIVQEFRLWTTAMAEKMDAGFFGANADGSIYKNGIIGKFDKTLKDIGKKLYDNLIYNKETKKGGLLFRIAAPAIKQLEKLRHYLVDRIKIPFETIAQSTKRSIQWMMRDAWIKTKHFGSSLWSRLKRFYHRRLSNPTSRLGKLMRFGGKIVSAPMKLGGKILGGTVGKLEKGAVKRMRKMAAQGKISQEEYNEFLKKRQDKKDAEGAKHRASMDAIQAVQNKLSINAIKDPKLLKQMKHFQKELARAEKMSQKAKKKGWKWDKKRAKAQAKKNMAKLKRGEELTYEEQMGALTAEQRQYRIRDDMKRKLEKELKRQEEKAEQDRVDREVERTEATSNIAKLLTKLTSFVVDGEKSPTDKTAKEIAAELDAAKEARQGAIIDTSMSGKEALEKAKERANKRKKDGRPMSPHEEITNISNTVKDAVKDSVQDAVEKVEKNKNKKNHLSKRERAALKKSKWDAHKAALAGNVSPATFGKVAPASAAIVGGSGFAASVAAGKIDASSGLRQGSYEDMKEDKRENIVAEKLEEIAENTKGDKKRKKKKEKDEDEESESRKSMFESITDFFKTSKKGGWKGAVKRYGKKVGGAAMMAAGGAAVSYGAYNFYNAGGKAVNIHNRYKDEGFASGTLGIMGEGADSKFNNQTGKKMDDWSREAIQQRFAILPFARHGARWSVRAIKGGTKLMGRGFKAMAPNTARMAARAGNVIKGKLGHILNLIMNSKFVKKYLGNKAANIGRRIMKTIGGRAVKSAGKFGLKALKFLTGPWGLLAMVLVDLGVGWANARRYFKIGKNDSLTWKMSLSAAIGYALNNQLLMGLLPHDLIVELIYNCIASDKEKKELDDKKNRLIERARALGVDADKLNEWENKGLLTKALDLFSSQDAIDKRDAKRLGMTDEEFKQFKIKNTNIIEKQENDRLKENADILNNLKITRKIAPGGANKQNIQRSGVVDGDEPLKIKAKYTGPKTTARSVGGILTFDVLSRIYEEDQITEPEYNSVVAYMSGKLSQLPVPITHKLESLGYSIDKIPVGEAALTAAKALKYIKEQARLKAVNDAKKGIAQADKDKRDKGVKEMVAYSRVEQRAPSILATSGALNRSIASVKNDTIDTTKRKEKETPKKPDKRAVSSVPSILGGGFDKPISELKNEEPKTVKREVKENVSSIDTNKIKLATVASPLGASYLTTKAAVSGAKWAKDKLGEDASDKVKLATVASPLGAAYLTTKATVDGAKWAKDKLGDEASDKIKYATMMSPLGASYLTTKAAVSGAKWAKDKFGDDGANTIKRATMMAPLGTAYLTTKATVDGAKWAKDKLGDEASDKIKYATMMSPLGASYLTTKAAVSGYNWLKGKFGSKGVSIDENNIASSGLKAAPAAISKVTKLSEKSEKPKPKTKWETGKFEVASKNLPDLVTKLSADMPPQSRQLILGLAATHPEMAIPTLVTRMGMPDLYHNISVSNKNSSYKKHNVMLNWMTETNQKLSSLIEAQRVIDTIESQTKTLHGDNEQIIFALEKLAEKMGVNVDEMKRMRKENEERAKADAIEREKAAASARAKAKEQFNLQSMFNDGDLDVNENDLIMNAV